ncbi:hypothetical protein Stuart_31 [Providencia phage vB_PstP_PS3]|uniref:Uncharacterized protein n=1 Tax=Providencia phage vB_PstP_PS3 TaxID=2848038 RepID=A0A411AWG3_9CAUD|nr:hypothetical protein HOV05_gp31 [Providencia phage vB_PstP_PS3]QAX92434.1 hypothetical protein Stuart_31 [Providencia phage vB_PstP_PS3]
MKHLRRTTYIKPKTTNQQLAEFIKTAIVVQSEYPKQHGKLLGN